jgi:hypothetical protein
MISNHRMLEMIAWTIAVCSCILTGIFGSTFGGDSWFLMAVFFIVFALISALCPILVNRTFSTLVRGNYVRVAILAPFAVFFIFTDLVTNGGTAALFRQADLVRADNQNTNAKNARSQVQRLEKRIAEIRADVTWTGSFRAPGAYDKLIESGEKYVEMESKRGGCGVKCEARMRELDSLRSERVNALRREALKTEMVTLERELKDAKVQVTETPTQASAALTHASNVAAGITGQVDPSAGAKFWANYGLSIWSGIAVTFASMAAAILLAFSGASMPARREPEPPAWERNPLPDLRPTAKQEAEEARIVLQQHDHTDDSLALLMQAVERINARYA